MSIYLFERRLTQSSTVAVHVSKCRGILACFKSPYVSKASESKFLALGLRDGG